MLKQMFQIGIVVPDAMAAACNFCELAGLSPSGIQFIDTEKDNTAAPTMYRDKKIVTYNKLAMVSVANVEFEFIEFSGASPNFNADYYMKHGPGISHICCDFGDYDSVTEKMLALGGEMVSDSGPGDYLYNYIDMRSSMGLVFENYGGKLKTMKLGSE